MKTFSSIALAFAPGIALAAAGGTGAGFGPEDWIDKWPVLAIVLCTVVGMTGFLASRIFARARAAERRG
ncbi:hypothetical protein [Anianabacter salinae]|uniref:hypothetical protein n=1 Tax=Anianabacter salinae TaxID=2851023 RepID=UPI00225E2DC7|nr:hypothetical protein [Anianabacter salinae]MBV0912198.1 hypothetical protein [Anianabacter salinae]